MCSGCYVAVDYKTATRKSKLYEYASSLSTAETDVERDGSKSKRHERCRKRIYTDDDVDNNGASHPMSKVRGTGHHSHGDKFKRICSPPVTLAGLMKSAYAGNLFIY